MAPDRVQVQHAAAVHETRHRHAEALQRTASTTARPATTPSALARKVACARVPAATLRCGASGHAAGCAPSLPGCSADSATGRRRQPEIQEAEQGPHVYSASFVTQHMRVPLGVAGRATGPHSQPCKQASCAGSHVLNVVTSPKPAESSSSAVRTHCTHAQHQRRTAKHTSLAV